MRLLQRGCSTFSHIPGDGSGKQFRVLIGRPSRKKPYLTAQLRHLKPEDGGEIIQHSPPGRRRWGHQDSPRLLLTYARRPTDHGIASEREERRRRCVDGKLLSRMAL